MEIGSIIDIPKTTLEAAGLKPGDLLRVRVVELEENGRALVEFDRQRAAAEIRFPVAAGEVLWVRVADTESRLCLQLVRSASVAASPAAAGAGPVRYSPELLHELQHRLQLLISAAEHRGQLPLPGLEPRQALEALGKFLAPIEPEAEPGVLSRSLARLVEESGVFLESRLARALTRSPDGSGTSNPAGSILAADLKARLLFLKAFAESAEGALMLAQNRELAGLMRAAGAVLTEIRSAQEQLVRQAAASEPFHMVHVALPMADGRADGTLKIAYRARRPAGTQDGHRASLLLSLDRLGDVRADLLLLQNALSVAVFVSDTTARDWVECHLSEVQAVLAEFFENVGVRVCVSEARIARFAHEDYRTAGEGQVDVRV